jgi:hypothetical protein
MTILEDYIKKLKAHDWYYEMSDDGRVYQKGKAERFAIESQRGTLDPQYEVWNQHCPPDYRR